MIDMLTDNKWYIILFIIALIGYSITNWIPAVCFGLMIALFSYEMIKMLFKKRKK